MTKIYDGGRGLGNNREKERESLPPSLPMPWFCHQIAAMARSGGTAGVDSKKLNSGLSHR